MHRITKQLTVLACSLAVAACGGQAKQQASDTNSGQKGQFGVFYMVNVSMPVGGKVTSLDGQIDCGKIGAVVTTNCTGRYDWGVDATLSAIADTTDAANPFFFQSWAADCGSGVADKGCVVGTNGPNKADKTVAAIFNVKDQLFHPRIPEGKDHAPLYFAFVENQPGALQCTRCHGADLKGVANAPSCAACHKAPPVNPVTGHFDASAVAWSDHTTGWSATCQRCHTNQGFTDRIGLDGSADYLGTQFAVTPTIPFYQYKTGITATATTPPGGAGYANGPLKCTTCHNSVSDPLSGSGLTKVLFPSAVNNSATVNVGVVDTDKSTALCAQCHQGRESTTSVNTKIGTTAVDTVIGTGTATVGTSFPNPHYLGAAATLFGNVAKGWAEYPNKIYTGVNQHGVSAGSCVSCHDAHSGKVEVAASSCGRCHFDETTGQPVTTFAQIEEQRQFGFEGDIDGDGVQESLKAEIEGLEATLYAAIQSYATQVVKADICYNGAAHPYYYVTGTDGSCGVPVNGVAATAFTSFTPRLLRAAFNNKWAHAEPGAWAHNPRYAIEILFDAITDLNAGISALTPAGTPVPFAGFRSFNGHFGGARAAAPYAAFLYTTGTGFTSAACYQCHGGATSMDLYLAQPLGTTLSLANKVTGMQCTTCHAPTATSTDMKAIRDIGTVYFPPQKNGTATPSPALVTIAKADLPDGFTLCATCHSGRENGKSVDNAIAANYALSATGLVATGGTTTTVVVTSPAPWSKDRYRNAKVTFTSGLNAGTTVVAKTSTVSSSATPNVAGPVTITIPAVANAVATGDTFDLTFDATTWGIGFTNPHYLGAAGMLLGSRAGMLYQYSGNTYAGNPINYGSPYGSPHGASCTGCHLPKATKHSFEIDLAATVVPGPNNPDLKTCNGCHVAPHELTPVKHHVEAATDELYVAIQAYATSKGVSLCYNGTKHPYWYYGVEVAGVCPTTTTAVLDYKAAKAAFNFKWSHAEPGAYAHNEKYILQGIYDSIVDLGGTPTFTRP